MSGQYRVRWFEESDLPAYIRGLNTNLYDEYDEARFKWKLVDTPWNLGFVSIAVVEHEGKPVAFNSFLPLMVRRGAEVFPIVQGCDGFVEPEHRRMGLFQLTLKFMFAELAEKGPEMLMGFNFSGSAGAAKKVGSTLTGDVHALHADAASLSKVKVTGEDDIEVNPCSLDELHGIYEDWASKALRLHIHRTIEYLRWRHSHPIRRSSFYRICDGEDEGYAAVNLECDGESNNLFLEDYTPIMHHSRVASALIKRVLTAGEPINEVYLTESTISPIYTTAQSLGFQPDHSYTMIMQNIHGLDARGEKLYRNDVELTSIENWHITSSDVF